VKSLNKVSTVLMAIAFLWAGLYMLCAQKIEGIYKPYKTLIRIIFGNEFTLLSGHITSIILVLGILYACKKIMNKRSNLPAIMAVIILVLLAMVPRLYLLYSVSIEQTSDYATYLVNSMSIYNNFSVAPEWQQYFGGFAANVPVICGIFALGFKLLGASVAVGLYMNVFFYTGAVIALYFIALHFSSKNTAFVSAAAYALWPNNISYSVSLASEPMYIFFLFLGLALFTYGIRSTGNLHWVLIFLSGAVLGLSQAIRPATVIFIIAIVIIFLFCSNKTTSELGSSSFGRRAAIIGALMAAYVASQWGLGLYTGKILPTIAKPTYGWSIFEGANLNTFGQWDAESSAIQDSVLAEYPLEQVQKVLLNKGIDRIKSYHSDTLTLLLINKTRNIFGNSAVFNRDLNLYITEQPTLLQSGTVPASILAWGKLSSWLYHILALYFIYVCFKCLSFMILKRERDNVSRIFFMLLPVCGIMAVHLLVTSIERYNYSSIPIIIMISMTFWEKYPFFNNGKYRCEN